MLLPRPPLQCLPGGSLLKVRENCFPYLGLYIVIIIIIAIIY